MCVCIPYVYMFSLQLFFSRELCASFLQMEMHASLDASIVLLRVFASRTRKMGTGAEAAQTARSMLSTRDARTARLSALSHQLLRRRSGRQL